jgi:hypothetical protein
MQATLQSEGESALAEFIEDDEVHAGQVISKPALPRVACLGLEPVDEIDHVVEPAAGAGSNATSGDRDVGFAGAGSADEHGITLLGEESAAGKIAHEGLVDRRALELEVVEILGGLAMVSWYLIERVWSAARARNTQYRRGIDAQQQSTLKSPPARDNQRGNPCNPSHRRDTKSPSRLSPPSHPDCRATPKSSGARQERVRARTLVLSIRSQQSREKIKVNTHPGEPQLLS